jgi:hypothetical protein
MTAHRFFCLKITVFSHLKILMQSFNSKLWHIFNKKKVVHLQFEIDETHVSVENMILAGQRIWVRDLTLSAKKLFVNIIDTRRKSVVKPGLTMIQTGLALDFLLK